MGVDFFLDARKIRFMYGQASSAGLFRADYGEIANAVERSSDARLSKGLGWRTTVYRPFRRPMRCSQTSQ